MNWTIPEFVNRSVASPAGTRLALGTGVCPRSAKNSTNRRRISAAGNATIRGSGVWTGGGIGRNGTERTVSGGCNATQRAGCRIRRVSGGHRGRVANPQMEVTIMAVAKKCEQCGNVDTPGDLAVRPGRRQGSDVREVRPARMCAWTEFDLVDAEQEAQPAAR